MAGEVEAQILVVVEDRGVNGAVEKGKDGVGCGRYYGRLDVRHEEVVVRLEYGASGHGGVVDYHGFLVVVDGLDLVAAGRGQEEQLIIHIIVAAVEHTAELRRAATSIDAEWIVYGDVSTGVAARGQGDRGWGQLDC